MIGTQAARQARPFADQNRSTASTLTGFYILPTIADHETTG
jgi:hypothetical protein